MRFDFSQAELKHIITHRVGNKSREEGFQLSNETTLVKAETHQYLIQYLLASLKTEETYSFTHPVQLYQNDAFALVEKIFNDEDQLMEASQNLAKLLHEYSTHPKVEAGELNVVYFSGLVFEGETLDALGIFKSEKSVPFLKINSAQTKFVIDHDFGFEIDNIDKGCLIFNSQKIDGYRMYIVDHINKSDEAKYWRDDFLKVKPVANEFHQTQQIMSITKDFVTKKLKNDLSKTDQIDLLNRSVDYFKSRDSFDKKEFESDVLKDEEIISSFRNYDSHYRERNNLELMDSFGISVPAVKRQARIFKSVLKLDKNFHIYIHGNRELIEQGVDEDGRKFYKIYFDQES